jgi:hypothetical protein
MTDSNKALIERIDEMLNQPHSTSTLSFIDWTREVVRLLQEARAALAQQVLPRYQVEWHSIAERQRPNTNHMVLLALQFSNRGRIAYGFLDMRDFRWKIGAGADIQEAEGPLCGDGTVVTHWAELPQTPDAPDSARDDQPECVGSVPCATPNYCRGIAMCCRKYDQPNTQRESENDAVCSQSLRVAGQIPEAATNSRDSPERRAQTRDDQSASAAYDGTSPTRANADASAEADLLPCPFCGSNDLTEDAGRVYEGTVDMQSGWVECENCKCSGPTANVANVTMQPARDAWNRRAPQPYQHCEKHRNFLALADYCPICEHLRTATQPVARELVVVDSGRGNLLLKLHNAAAVARDAALEEAAKMCEDYAKRHDDIRRAALEVCADHVRALKREAKP